MPSPRRRLHRVRRTGIAAVVALSLGFAAVPTAAYAADHWYASGLASSENQWRGSSQATMKGARGGAASTFMRFHLVNVYPSQAQIASSTVDGTSTSFSHPTVAGAFSSCKWSYPESDVSGTIGLSCAYVN